MDTVVKLFVCPQTIKQTFPTFSVNIELLQFALHCWKLFMQILDFELNAVFS
jgi:hypothetical protein